MTRFLACTCLLVLLAPSRGVAAEDVQRGHPSSFELRSWDESHRRGLQAARLSVTIASINVVYLTSGALWIANANDVRRRGVQRAQVAIGSIQLAGAVANLVWLVYAGGTLRDYKEKASLWNTVRRARLDTAFSGIDTAFRLAGTAGGIAALTRHRTIGVSVGYSRRTGLLFLIPNLAVLPFHIWALVANGKELRYRKRAREWTRARRVEPIPSGFRF